MLEKIRVAVVDDHPIYRLGLVQTLRQDSSIEVVAEGATSADAVRIALEQVPDVMLLDVQMPGGGVEAAKAISTAGGATRIVMLTVSEQDRDVMGALEAGALGYVLKGVSGPDLLRTVRAISRGETYIMPGLAARLLRQFQRKPQQRAVSLNDPGLSAREEQILNHVAHGLTNKEIANKLDLSEKTVKHYMTNVMQKLQVRNRVEAVLVVKQRVSANNQG